MWVVNFQSQAEDLGSFHYCSQYSINWGCREARLSLKSYTTSTWVAKSSMTKPINQNLSSWLFPLPSVQCSFTLKAKSRDQGTLFIRRTVLMLEWPRNVWLQSLKEWREKDQKLLWFSGGRTSIPNLPILTDIIWAFRINSEVFTQETDLEQSIFPYPFSGPIGGLLFH